MNKPRPYGGIGATLVPIISGALYPKRSDWMKACTLRIRNPLYSNFNSYATPLETKETAS